LALFAGLPAFASAPRVLAGPRDQGIGGTGASIAPDESEGDRGIGGTGVIGTITCFGSIVVNGLRIAYPENASMRIDGAAAPPAALRIGQVVRVIALESGGQFSTRPTASLVTLIGGLNLGGVDPALIGQRAVLQGRLADGAFKVDHAKAESALLGGGLRTLSIEAYVERGDDDGLPLNRTVRAVLETSPGGGGEWRVDSVRLNGAGAPGAPGGLQEPQHPGEGSLGGPGSHAAPAGTLSRAPLGPHGAFSAPGGSAPPGPGGFGTPGGAQGPAGFGPPGGFGGPGGVGPGGGPGGFGGPRR
jgi:hypothetical protein